MQRLISQNGVEIDHSIEFRVFECKKCGAKFESNEYEVRGIIETEKESNFNVFLTKGKLQLIDICFTCLEPCIIIEDKVEN